MRGRRAVASVSWTSDVSVKPRGRAPHWQSWLLAWLLALTAIPACLAQNSPDAGMPPFPELTGPVVDDAHLLPAGALNELSQKLAAYSQQNGTQLVVVTLPTLNGYPIEDYGYQLGRHWGIGQKGKNNGVLLIVDAGERKVRVTPPGWPVKVAISRQRAMIRSPRATLSVCVAVVVTNRSYNFRTMRASMYPCGSSVGTKM